ncbi:hypothetical protein M426DRAFT_216668 [Hypoxylon sp. CI-4A]|nr:hypothetical protein M426DRAFT_216668 [Hypoxylon sp. CI-4A]
MPPLAPLSTAAKEAKMTPERARLMKAMKLREKKKMMNSTVAEQTSKTDKLTTSEEKEKKEEDGTELKNSLGIQGDVGHRTVSHADSGFAIDPPTPMTINTEDTSDSHPNSPTAATSSEIGVSTKASSLSESTDETVQATKDTNEEAQGTAFQEEPNGFSRLDDQQISAVEPRMGHKPEEAGRSQGETQETAVSEKMNIKAAENPHEIPGHDADLQPESSIRQSIEVDDPIDATSSSRVTGTEQVVDEDKPKSPLEIPISKFSSNEPKTPTSPISPAAHSLKSKFSIPDIAIPADSVPIVPSIPSRHAAGDRARNLDESPPDASDAAFLAAQKLAKRKTFAGPIRTDLTKTTPHSEASDPLLDDALMDELQSATLQEAKPMLVSKSPITPVFPNTSPLRQVPQLSRTVSNPMRGPLLAPSDVSQSTARSVSAGGAALLHSITRQPSNAGLQAKKNNLGSSISQRIKALEKISGSPSTEDLRPRTATPSSTFFAVRKQSVREPSRSPSVVDRADSLTRNTPTPEQSREGTPETPGVDNRRRSLSVASRLSMFESQPPHPPRGRPESIQVTARIIRDPSQSLPRKPDANTTVGDYPQLELKQSPLIVDLQRTEHSQPELKRIPSDKIPKETIQERRDKSSTSDDVEKKRRRSSLSIVKEFMKDRRTSIVSKSTDNLALMTPNGVKSPNRPPSSHQNTGGLARRLSISSRRSSMSRERDNGASPMGSPAVLSDSGSGDDDKSDRKSKNRASRFIRRLSNSLTGNRKAVSPAISPTVAEEDADQLAAASITNVSLSSQPTVVAYMGDVNVQFPDNLLWKRRSMCLDTQGFLFLSAIQGAATAGKEKVSGVGNKRYHLSDFRAPYIPDVEIQELPNSVVLDLVEGSCLQIACEDRAGQLNILNTLQDAHQSHSSGQ